MRKFICVLLAVFLFSAAAIEYLISHRNALIADALPYAENLAAQTLGTNVTIGSAALDEFSLSKFKDSQLIVKNIVVFDKKSSPVANIDTARITFKLLTLADNPAAAVSHIDISGANLFIQKRDDNSWNFNDIKPKSSGESSFSATISVDNAALDASFDGKNISAENIQIDADCSDMSNISAKISADSLGSHVDAAGTYSADKQILNARIDSADLMKFLPFLPENTLPENLAINSGTVSNIYVNALRNFDVLSFSGSADFAGGSVTLEDTEIKNITGAAKFTDAEIILTASAAANDQFVSASGSIRVDTDSPFFDIRANSQNFTPAAFFPNLGIAGSAAFDAHLVGTAQNPRVNANVSSKYLAYENISAENVSANLRYANNAVFLSNIRADSFGGAVAGEAEIHAQSLAFNAHLKADGASIPALKNFASLNYDVDGFINADVAISGNAGDLSTLKVFGEFSSPNLTYQNFPLAAKSSFYYGDNSVTLDYLNLTIPDRGKINLEGKIENFNRLDLDFYGAHANLALIKNFINLDIGGLSDFRGGIHGNIDNPNLNISLSAVAAPRGNFPGVIFGQEYDSLTLAASGSADSVNVEDFQLEKDGKLKWTVIDGVVSLTGDKNINLRLDTIGARIEDIVAVVAPDQELTGNVDNTIRITGTLDKPNIVGYMEFSYGAYRGFLVNSMRGDYFLDGNSLRLQDFVITSPMVDMVLNGTIDVKTYDMDFVVLGNDINLRRFQSKFPSDYPVEGHGTFEGLIGGNLDAPIFDGKLTGGKMNFNGVELQNIIGHVTMNGAEIALEDFKFNQRDGSYNMQLTMNTATKLISGRANVRNVDIPELAALVNQKTKMLTGKVNSEIVIGGTMDNPAVKASGNIISGALAGYDLHDVAVDINLVDRVAYVQRFEGRQGDKGKFNVSGTAGLYGPIDLTATASDIELAMLGAIGGVEDVTGSGNLDAKITGTLNNPSGEIKMTAQGGIKGSNFDLLRANISLSDWIFNVRELIVERAIGANTYRASATGTVPIQALYIDSGERVAPSDQLNLRVSLDEADLSLLPMLSDYVAWGAGNMSGGLNITGTASAPAVNGNITLSDGTVKIKGMTSLIEHIDIATRFSGNNFKIENFTGNIGAGTFDIDGGFDFANYAISNYNFDLNATNLDVKSAVFNGLVNGDFNLSEVKWRNGSLPKISGVLDFDKCMFSIPTLPESEEALPEILLDVTVNLGEKVHFYSSRLYNMFLTGNVKFERSTTHPKTSGVINVKRGGTVTYIQTTFNIREGEAHFNQIESFMPTIHFNADATVASTKVYLTYNGVFGESKLRLSSSPEMSETEIAQLLTLRDAYGNSTNNMTATDILAIGLQMSILGDIEDTVRRTLGIDRFMLQSGSGSAFEHREQDDGKPNEEFNISIGKYVSDKVMVRYTQGLNGGKIKRYGLQYDMNDNLGLTIEREGNEYIFAVEARYKF